MLIFNSLALLFAWCFRDSNIHYIYIYTCTSTSLLKPFLLKRMKRPAAAPPAKSRKLKKEDTTDSIASEDYPTTIGRSKHMDANYIKCKECDMIYAPAHLDSGFSCRFCGCDKFTSHMDDPHA